MAFIKFELPEEYKRELKVKAAKNDISLTKLILNSLYTTDPPQFETSLAIQSRIDEITNILAKFGMKMTKEEREKLKAEREELKRKSKI